MCVIVRVFLFFLVVFYAFFASGCLNTWMLHVLTEKAIIFPEVILVCSMETLTFIYLTDSSCWLISEIFQQLILPYVQLNASNPIHSLQLNKTQNRLTLSRAITTAKYLISLSCTINRHTRNSKFNRYVIFCRGLSTVAFALVAFLNPRLICYITLIGAFLSFILIPGIDMQNTWSCILASAKTYWKHQASKPTNILYEQNTDARADECNDKNHNVLMLTYVWRS